MKIVFLFILLLACTCGKNLSNDQSKCKQSDISIMTQLCLRKGYQPHLNGCKGEDTDQKLNNRELKLCKDAESTLKICKFTCPKKSSKFGYYWPTNAPGPDPTDPSPKPTPEEIYTKCAHVDINFHGTDYYNKISRSTIECVEDCLRTESCKSVTYRFSDRRCFFKSQRGGLGPTTAAGHTSVDMGCDRSFTDMTCQREGIAFNGADIRNIAAANIEDCILLCKDTEHCKSVSFFEPQRICYLKSKEGGASGPSKHNGMTSMNLKCDNSPVTNLNCLREGIIFHAADLKTIVAADEVDCVKYCRDTEQCVAFTFRESDHLCILKSRRGGHGPVKAAGHNSMNMECDNSAVTNLNCLRDNTDYPGADIRQLTVADEEECVRHCRDTETCKSLTFRESDQLCFLKSRQGGSGGPRPSFGVSSMNMECDNSEVTNLDCIREGIVFHGADIGNLLAADEEECVRFCRDTELCKSITYREADHRCFLKSMRGGLGPVPAAGHSSLNLKCDNSPVRNLNCLREDINFHGADIRNIVTPNEEDCVRHCRDTENCVSFTYRISDKRCFLKNREGGSGPQKANGHNSMNMHCDNSPVTISLLCLREDVWFPNVDIMNIIATDEEACARHCRDNDFCVAISFRKHDHRCFLKSRKGGHPGPQSIAGHNSMNMECDNSKVDLSCAEENDNFPGHDIMNIIRQDLEACVRICRDTTDCSAVSFDQINKRCFLKRKSFEWWEKVSTVNYWSTNLSC
ncbi:hypothetical protein ACHWQZ_G015330 [Mnemiopsis leidyi]